jgi:thiamine pyrophosphate-dependent acetolactate synthase large subunit-like protein
MATMKKFGQTFMEILELYGITHSFGIPGAHTIELFRGHKDRGIQHVTPRHEQGAGFMAYGYGLATGRPAACLLITGPGLVNAATAMGECRSESVPSLFVATNNAVKDLGMDHGRLHQAKSQIAIANELSDSCHLLLEQSNVNSVLGGVFSRFNAGRPGPAYIEIPIDLLSQETETEPVFWPAASPPAPDEHAIRNAASAIRNARQPVIIFGGGARGAAVEALELVSLIGCPVVTTTAGKGVIPSSHPLNLGATLPFSAIHQYLEEADLVLAVGTELSDTDTLYTFNHYSIGDGLIRIDIDIAQLSRNFCPQLAILSDAKLALSSLLAEIRSKDFESNIPTAKALVESLKTKTTAEWIPGATKHKRVIDIISEVVAADAIIFTDECQLGYTANQYYPSEKPGCYFHPMGYGTLGVALPAAIGASIGCPGRQVITIVGDGSFLFSVQELVTAVEMGITLPIIVWNNKGYGAIADMMDEVEQPHLSGPS